MDYVIDLVGEDAVGIGTDFTQGYDKPFFDWITHDKGFGRRLTDFGTVVNPAGFQHIRDFPTSRMPWIAPGGAAEGSRRCWGQLDRAARPRLERLRDRWESPFGIRHRVPSGRTEHPISQPEPLPNRLSHRRMRLRVEQSMSIGQTGSQSARRKVCTGSLSIRSEATPAIAGNERPVVPSAFVA